MITGNQSTARAGTEISLVKTERQQVSLSLAEMDRGSWVIFEPPGFHHGSLRNGTAQHGRITQGERDVLFQGGDALWSNWS